MTKTVEQIEQYYAIFANYGRGVEEVCAAENLKDARRLLKEYRDNEGSAPHHHIKNVRIYKLTKFTRI
jgi:hypothetical protein